MFRNKQKIFNIMNTVIIIYDFSAIHKTNKIRYLGLHIDDCLK
jgi:hypothetical protein